MLYDLRKITSPILNQLKVSWQSELARRDLNPARCLGSLSRSAEIVQDEHDKNQYAYACFRDDVVVAVVLLSHACPKSEKSWLKVLEITLAPALIDNEDPVSADTLINIFASIVVEVINMADTQYLSKTVKIYSDSIMDIRMLKSLAEKLREQDSSAFESSSHRGWLILKSTGRIFNEHTEKG